MSILISENDLLNAVKEFLKEAEIPSTGKFHYDNFIVREKVIPAYLKSLEQLGNVRLCSPFSIESIKNKWGI